MSTHVVIGRKWNNPNITVNVTAEGIAISMPLSDFIVAVTQEMGNPTMLLTSAQLLARASDAAARVVAGMKKETAKVM